MTMTSPFRPFDPGWIATCASALRCASQPTVARPVVNSKPRRVRVNGAPSKELPGASWGVARIPRPPFPSQLIQSVLIRLSPLKLGRGKAEGRELRMVLAMLFERRHRRPVVAAQH